MVSSVVEAYGPGRRSKSAKYVQNFFHKLCCPFNPLVMFRIYDLDSNRLFFKVCAKKKSPVRAVPLGTWSRMAQLLIENKSTSAEVAAVSSLQTTPIKAVAPRFAL